MTLGMVEVESGERWARQEPLTRWLGACWRQWGCFIKAVCSSAPAAVGCCIETGTRLKGENEHPCVFQRALPSRTDRAGGGSQSVGDGQSDPDHNVVIASEDQRSRNVPEFHYAIDERERLRLRP